MRKINYIQDTKKFWRAHKVSRDAIDKDIASRPPAEQRVIRATMHANHTAMRNAKKVSLNLLQDSLKHRLLIITVIVSETILIDIVL